MPVGLGVLARAILLALVIALAPATQAVAAQCERLEGRMMMLWEQAQDINVECLQFFQGDVVCGQMMERFMCGYNEAIRDVAENFCASPGIARYNRPITNFLDSSRWEEISSALSYTGRFRLHNASANTWAKVCGR